MVLADQHQGNDHQGIEGDDYSACEGDFYARANIRSIAEAVGAEPEPLIREYDEVHRAPSACWR